MIKTAIVILLFLVTQSLAAQDTAAYKIAAWPKAENIPWIDSLLTVTGYEKYFKEYCIKAIQKKAVSAKWDSTVIQARIALIDFNLFKDYAIYNALSSYTQSEFKMYIRAIKEAGRVGAYPIMIDKLGQGVIEINLAFFVKRYTD
jgi:hypothetical protein